MFLPGEFHRQRSLVDYSPWGCKESDMTEQLTFRGFPGSTSSKEPACQCRRHKRHGFDPRVRKIPWRRAWQPTPVFLPRESQEPGGLQSIGTQRVGHDWSDLARMHAERKEHVHRDLEEKFAENNIKIQSNSHKRANSGSSEGSLFTRWTCLAHINVR